MWVSAASDVGKIREINEDNFCDCVHPEFGGLRLTAVADGMGGHQAGEVASKLAIDFLCERFTRLLDLAQPREWLIEAIQAANGAIMSQAHQGAELAGMGTTLTAAIILDHRAGAGRLPESVPPKPGGGLTCLFGHVGDSRMYVFDSDSGELRCVTNDHSLVGELLRKGDLTEEEAQRHPQRNVLTQALGAQRPVEVQSGEFPLSPGDTVVLCTDGLTSLLTPDDLALQLSLPDFEGSASRLVELALSRGGHDNVTVVLVRI